jgi:uncharacterized membrane protein
MNKPLFRIIFFLIAIIILIFIAIFYTIKFWGAKKTGNKRETRNYGIALILHIFSIILLTFVLVTTGYF